MKEITDALDRVYAEKERCNNTIAKLLQPGSVVTYKHGCHAIEAEVISASAGRFGGVVWVKGVKSGREYTLHPGRIEHVA